MAAKACDAPSGQYKPTITLWQSWKKKEGIRGNSDPTDL